MMCAGLGKGSLGGAGRGRLAGRDGRDARGDEEMAMEGVGEEWGWAGGRREREGRGGRGV